MFGIANWCNNQVLKAQIAEENKPFNKAAKPIAEKFAKLWEDKAKEVRASRLSNDGDITVDDMQRVMNQILELLELNPDDSDVKDISDRIFELTIENKEHGIKKGKVKPLFHRLAVLTIRSKV